MDIRDERGMMAIGVAFMLIVVLGLFGGALWQYSMAEMNRVERFDKELRAQFLARAGAEAVMEAWLEESWSNKPEGTMDRIYYNLDAQRFQTEKPANYLGYVDVVVTRIDDPDPEGSSDDLTEIVATAVVDGVTSTARVTTYPYLYGHDDSLAWYGKDSGTLRRPLYVDPGEPVVVKTAGPPVHFPSKSSPPSNLSFRAPAVLFGSPIDFSYGQTVSYYPLLDPEWWVDVQYSFELPIRAETIIFDDVTLANLPATGGLFPMRATLRLELPSETAGKPGSQIPGADATKRYGIVFFDGQRVQLQNLRWKERKFLGITLRWYIELVGSPQPLYIEVLNESGQKEPLYLAGRAFYFRDGTDLLNLQEKDLIPIREDVGRARIFDDFRPYIWMR